MARKLYATQPQLDFKPDVPEPLRRDCGEEAGRTRPFVRITVYTLQLYDGVDNLRGACKFLIDQLRYSTLISTDRFEEDFQILQQKVHKRNEVGTSVQIIYPTKSSTVYPCE